MKNKIKKKSVVYKITISVIILFFLDQCTLINITTSDIFKPSYYINSKQLSQKITSEKYELVPVNGTFPVLFDSIKNEFYVKNENGLIKYDSVGNIIISADLPKEYSSTSEFENFIPYVIVEKGVYDFTSDKLVYKELSKILNFKNEMSEQEFNDAFEKNYKAADIVIYDSEFYVEHKRMCTPMYFRIGGNWTLLYSKTDAYRYTHQDNQGIDDIIIGRVDHMDFPAKFNNTGLTVLKDNKNGIYSTIQNVEKVTDEYFQTFVKLKLNEENFNYSTSNEVSLASRKKESFDNDKYYLGIPSFIAPDFINIGYYKIEFNNENLYFKEKALKQFGHLKCTTETYLYEVPTRFRKKTKVAFLYYGLDLGGNYDSSTGVTDQIIKNNGLYIIRPKKSK